MLFALKNNIDFFAEGFSRLIKYRILILEMTRRELTDQYAGQVLGFFWAICHPIIWIAIYIFIFAVVFRTRIAQGYEMPLDYTAYILSGLVPWLGFQQAMTKACVALTGKADLVKQVVFPIDILPTKMVLSSLFGEIICLAVLVIYVFFTHGLPMKTYLLLPFLLFFQILAMQGVSYFLAAISPFFKDIKDLITIFTLMGIYLIPVVYLPAWVPKAFKPIIYVNPFSYMVWTYQDVLYFGRIEHPVAWLVFAFSSVFAFTCGYRFFKKLTPYFGNVL